MRPFKTKQQRLNKKFLKACRREKVAALEEILAAGADINAKDPYDGSAFDVAMGWNNFAVAKFLVERGIDRELGDLAKACASGQTQIIELLLRAGADINETNSYGETGLHRAAYYGQFNTVKLLVEKGADINALDSQGNKPESVAKKSEHFGIADYLRDITPPEKREVAFAKSGWSLSAPEVVACVSEEEGAGYALTEIFNFRSCTYTHITRNLKTSAENTTLKFFSEIPDKKILEDAHRELEKLGGKADRRVIYGRVLDKKSVP